MGDRDQMNPCSTKQIHFSDSKLLILASQTCSCRSEGTKRYMTSRNQVDSTYLDPEYGAISNCVYLEVVKVRRMTEGRSGSVTQNSNTNQDNILFLSSHARLLLV